MTRADIASTIGTAAQRMGLVVLGPLEHHLDRQHKKLSSAPVQLSPAA